MRTKTLVAVVAAIAVGIISSQAQVYSQNIVGYYNTTVPGNGFGLIAQQLDNGTGNGVSDIFGPGLVSDAGAVNNSQLMIWDPVGQAYATYYYFNAADSSYWGASTAGFYGGGGDFYNGSLTPGQAAFILNVNNVSQLNCTVVGSVLQATNKYTILQGFNLVALAAPVGTDLVGALGNFQGYSDPAGNNNDQLLVWDPVGQAYATYYYWNAADSSYWGASTAGFYGGGGDYFTATPAAGQAYFINHVVAGTEYWTNTFNFNN